MKRLVITGCESLEGKALTIDRKAELYYIGDRTIPFSTCVVKEGRIYYFTPLSTILNNMGFKGVEDVTSNTVICTGYDNQNRNIKDVELVTIKDKVRIKITLKSEFPLYNGYESLSSSVY